MSSVAITNINPIGLVAVVTPILGGGYSLTLQYSTSTDVVAITDDFASMPSTVTVDVTSSTVPSGHHLEAAGSGTWTTISSSSLTGTFPGSGAQASIAYDFTILLSNGSSIVARHDPRLLLRKLN